MNVIEANAIFMGCTALKKIKQNFNFPKAKRLDEIFENCEV